MTEQKLETTTLAAGCFWCTEAIFQRLKGVEEVTSGYAGGDMDEPSYEAVSAGTTGHAEAIQITFDSTVIPYEKILEVFFATHDPTTMNRQGSDVGSQYRSVIFYHTEAQREAAEKTKQDLEASGKYDDPIVTEIVPFQKFYSAEDYHQNFYNQNPKNGYCQLIIDPKIEKLTKEFKEQVKKPRRQ